MRYESVIWDWNGTLLDDVALALGIANDIFVDHGLAAISRERYTRVFDFPVQVYYERVGMTFEDKSFEAISEHFCQRFEDELVRADLYDGVADVLASIKDAGLDQMILSATEHESLHRMVNRFGIAHHFDHIQGMPHGLATGKSEIGMRLLDDRQLEASSTVLIGDTLHDREVADMMGVDCILVATGHQSRERLTATGKTVVESIADVVPLVNG